MPYLIAIIGPTAVGKTRLAIRMAQLFQTVVLSCDARQMYKHLDIGTAKPSEEERAGIPHYFIDNLEPQEAYTAGQFERESTTLLHALFQAHEVVVSVGGSTLYNQALWYGLDDIPAASAAVRENLNQQFKTAGLAPLLTELAHVDPETYARIDLNNPARIIRALEVYRESGTPLSAFQGKLRPERPFQLILIGLDTERKALYQRIDQRVDAMIAQGLIGEVQQLLEKGYSTESQALQSIGYREIIDYLTGEYEREEAIRLIKRNSRRYAKRQLTWYRKNQDIHWFEAGDEAKILSFIEARIRAGLTAERRHPHEKDQRPE